MLIAGNDALNFTIIGRWLDAVPVIGDSMDALVAKSMSAGLQRLTLMDSWDVNRQRNSTFTTATATATPSSNTGTGLAVLGVFVDALIDVPRRWIAPIKGGVQSNLGHVIIGTGMVGHDVVLLVGRGTTHVLVLLTDVVEQRSHGIAGTDVQTNLHGGPHGRGCKGGCMATEDAVTWTAVAGEITLRPRRGGDGMVVVSLGHMRWVMGIP
mmetsp:Transcript_14371/g.41308  ORF Transcript_14371/g.41308 Transcript_14371/m.41308 type:complete len:210 (-) Transcript_14371:127-756(-)